MLETILRTLPTSTEIGNGANAALAGASFLVWAATIWLYFYGDWRRHPEPGARKSASMFIIGVALVALSHWTQRSYWFAALLIGQGVFRDIDFMQAWGVLLSSLKLVGVIGYVMMLYPVGARFKMISWPYLAGGIFMTLFAAGVWVT